jgi:aryl-alcohol dehydrogenase-like predicted oxidoreductase
MTTSFDSSRPDRSVITRRDALKLGVSAGLTLALDGLPAVALTAPQATPLIERAIPSTGEKLPIVGVGTARNYENPATADALAPLREVLREFPQRGGRVLDTAPSYGRAESVVGDLLQELGNRNRYFLATKVSARGGDRAGAIAQMEESLRRLRTDHIDLMQIWNVSSPDLLLPILDEWKAAKRIRYTGVTTSSARQYDQLESLMKKAKLDFIQADLSIDNRGSQDRLLPLAGDRGMAVLINLPFGRSRVFAKVQGKPLPDWAHELDVTSWAQLFLKYILGNPAVTVVIPGTEKLDYLVDNLGAARGRLPDAAMRKRIEAYYDAL